jgi:hypothetical protein
MNGSDAPDIGILTLLDGDAVASPDIGLFR